MPNVKRNQLSTLQVKNAKPGLHTDGDGLMLRVKPSGRKSWVLRLTVDGKRRNLGLGAYPAVSLRDAREHADELRKTIRRGEDPADHLKARGPVRRVVEPAIPTFAEAAETVIELRALTWSSTRHATQWRESLRLYALPVLGDRRVDDIETADVLAILQPIWTSKAETAGRIRQRMATIFDYCIAAGWIDGNPCNGAMKAALPRRTRQRRHHPALPYDEISDALTAFREATAHEDTKLALEFLILTAARAGEVRHATWDQIDLQAAEGPEWKVPAENMKMRRPHRVPLSRQALAVLKTARKRTGGKGLVFPSNRKKGQPFSNMAFAMLLRRAGYGHVTTHGFRATFRTWALEQTDAPWAVAEAALAHNLGGGEVMAYVRSDLIERRHKLMQEWGSFVSDALSHERGGSMETTLTGKYASLMEEYRETQRDIKQDEVAASVERDGPLDPRTDSLIEGLIEVLREPRTKDEEAMKALLAKLEGHPMSIRDHSRVRDAVYWSVREGWLPEHFRATFNNVGRTPTARR